MNNTYRLARTFHRNVELTEKVLTVMRMFGVDLKRLRESGSSHECQVRLQDGDICYITGASGAGKSVLLGELQNAVSSDESVNLDEIELEDDRSLIDCFSGDCLETLKTLSKSGLNDVFTVLNQPRYLSDGQKYRFRLAKALSTERKIIFADEFCSALDRISAAVIAYNIRKFADHNGTIFVLASSHDDIMSDLQPDVVIVKHLNGETEVIYKDIRRQVTVTGRKNK